MKKYLAGMNFDVKSEEARTSCEEAVKISDKIKHSISVAEEQQSVFVDRHYQDEQN